MRYMTSEKRSNQEERRYSSLDLAVIVPTKDRPQKIRNLLESLSDQTVSCGRIIVVDSGEDIGSVVRSFLGRLPVEYHRSPVQGQIHQRNIGISLVDDSTPLVCSLDDDIFVEPGAIEAMVNFWNHCEAETAGVSFNIVNNPPYRHSWMKSVIGMSSPQQGRVLRSGYNVAASPTKIDLKVRWLCGGATVWRQEILKQFSNKEVSSRWAICEDLIFSYPIGRRYPLYVCADAKVRHEHVYDHKGKSKYRYYGRTVVLWRLYFVGLHPELSKVLFFWMVLWQIISRLSLGVLLGRRHELQYGIGQIEGALIGLYAIIRRSNLSAMLDESDEKS